MKPKDPGLYRKLSEPFESDEAANAALLAFQDELYELRVKHRIKDLAWVAEINIARPVDGDDDSECEFPAIVSNHYGDSMRSASLFAYAHGEAVVRHERAVAEFRAVGDRMARNKP